MLSKKKIERELQNLHFDNNRFEQFKQIPTLKRRIEVELNCFDFNNDESQELDEYSSDQITELKKQTDASLYEKIRLCITDQQILEGIKGKRKARPSTTISQDIMRMSIYIQISKETMKALIALELNCLERVINSNPPKLLEHTDIKDRIATLRSLQNTYAKRKKKPKHENNCKKLQHTEENGAIPVETVNIKPTLTKDDCVHILSNIQFLLTNINPCHNKREVLIAQLVIANALKNFTSLPIPIKYIVEDESTSQSIAILEKDNRNLIASHLQLLEKASTQEVNSQISSVCHRLQYASENVLNTYNFIPLMPEDTVLSLPDFSKYFQINNSTDVGVEKEIDRNVPNNIFF